LQLQGEDFSDITSTITRFFSVPPCLHGEIFLICAYQRSSAAKGLVFSISAIFGNLGSSRNPVSDPRSSAFIRGKDCFSRVQFGCLAFQLLKSQPCLETS